MTTSAAIGAMLERFRRYIVPSVIGILLSLSASSSSKAADPPPNVEWTLLIGEPLSPERTVSLPKGDYSFKEGNFNCEVNAAEVVDGPTGLSEVRGVICKSPNDAKRSNATFCSRKQNANSAEFQVNGKTITIGCAVRFK